MHWSDPEININWPDQGSPPLLSSKDRSGRPFAYAEYFD
ncbi:hypothetical protein [Marinobacter alexandrii]